MKKMNLFAVTCMCIGTIIGVGIFGSMPTAANYVGPSLVVVCMVAVFEILIRYLPSLVPASAIPASNGFYMYLSRLVNPYVGFLQVIQILFNVFVLALLATVFAQYFNLIVTVSPKLVAITVILLFGFIAYFGLRVGAMAQNIMVIVLLSALGIYVVFGLPMIKPEYFTINKALSMDGVDFTSFGAALGLIASCLMGGYVGVNYAENIENPSKTIIQAFIISTIGVGVLYSFMSMVTTGTVPYTEVTSLAEVAKVILPEFLYWYFIVGGALFALATTINGVILGGMVNLGVIARDKVLPEIFNKKNKHGAAVTCLITFIAIGLIIVYMELSVETLMSVSSVLGIIIAIAQFIPAIRVRKKYPNCYKNSPIKLPMNLIYTFIVIACFFCLYEAYSLIIKSSSSVWIALLITIVLSYGYFFIRIAYLKNKGIDLIKIMSTPYEPWEEKEKSLASISSKSL